MQLHQQAQHAPPRAASLPSNPSGSQTSNPFLQDTVQTAFAACAAPLVIVQAPPGAGKTEALAMRFDQALQSDVEPDRILVISFTNRARSTFEHRLAQRQPSLAHRIAPPQERKYLPVNYPPLWIGTFHDIVARILRLHPELATVPPRFSVETGNSRIIRMRAALHLTQRLPSGDKHANRRAAALVRLWDSACAAGIMPDASANAGPPLSSNWNNSNRSSSDIQVFRAFRAMQTQDGVADVSLMPVALRLLYHQHPDIENAWSHRWDEIMVDEYQDTSPILTALLATWARNGALAAAGDTDQNIYSFAHAIGSFHHIQPLTGKPDPVVLALQNDYRLTEQIQTAVNRIRGNLLHPGATPLPATRQGPPPAAHCTLDVTLPKLLRQHIIDDIASHARIADRESTFSDATILCRTHQETSQIAAALAASGIPVWLHQDKDSSSIAHDVTSWLRIIANPANHVAFPTAMSACSPAPPPVFLDETESLSRASQTSPEQSMAALAFKRPEQDRTRIAAFHALSILHDCRARFDNPSEPVPDALNHLLERIGFEQRLATTTLPVQKATRLAIERLQYISRTVDTLQQLLDLHQDLDHLGDEPPENTVEIRTMHGAKGHQAPCLYAINWEEGTFPKYDDNTLRLDEDRKLALVALSRASYSFRCYVRDDAGGPGTTNTRPSRFIAEAGIPIQNNIRLPALQAA